MWNSIVTVAAFSATVILLAATILIQWLKRRQAEEGLLASLKIQRQMTGRLIESQETERRRIARELHDDLNQSLALLAIELDVLAQQSSFSQAKTAERLCKLSGQVKEMSTAVHSLSHMLHPSKLEQVGLVFAVKGLCEELKRHHGLQVKFMHSSIPAAIPKGTALCLYRVVQEALRNVVRHSGSVHAMVELTGTSCGLCLKVSDSGVGFDPAAQNAAGLGLVSMRERLDLTGGELTINSRPAGGTRLSAFIPTPRVPSSGHAEIAVRHLPSFPCETIRENEPSLCET